LRKGYGTLLATIVAFSVLLGPRPNTPAAPAAGQSNTRSADLGAPTADRFVNENFTACKTDADARPPCSDCNPFCPAKDLLDAIQAHYGAAEGATEKKSKKTKTSGYRAEQHWGVPEGENKQILFVIATVPDPIYTHLSLFFDRSIDSIIKGAQASDFFFSRATMPWDNDEHPDSADLKLRMEQQTYREHREDFPGLMIFRPASRSVEDAKPWHVNGASALFVLVVGETPTGGIRKEQFKNALRVIREIRGADAIPESLRHLRILGTTFSGSLASLKQVWSQEPGRGGNGEFPKILIHSGTASSWDSTNDFREFLVKKEGNENQPADNGQKTNTNPSNDSGMNAEFVTFQESDQYADEHFCRYMVNQGYEASDMAILSEDETAYGNISRDDSKKDGEQTQPAAQQTGKQQKSSNNANPTDCRGPMVRLYFPRDISQLRAAYQRELKIQNSAENSKNAPQLTLPLNLDTTGSDGDSVPPYATLQTPLWQESVLFGVVANLRKHRIRVVLVRATSSLDTLFLCQFLRTSYPDARIVTIGSDLLYQRDFDKPSLHGILSITNYPLLPGIDDEVAEVSEAKGSAHEDRVFSDSYSVGVFNAFLSLVADGSSEIPVEKEKDNAQWSQEHRPVVLPVARYEQFGWPALSGKDAGHGLTPPLWLTVNGRGGAWPLALLDEDAGSDQKLRPASNLNAILLRDKDASPSEGSAPASAPLEWQIAEIGALGMALLFSWFMAYPPRFPRSEALATFRLDEDDYRDRLLFAFGWLMIGVQCVFLYPWLYWEGREHQLKLFLGPTIAVVAVTAGCTIGLYLRGSRRLAKAFPLSAAIVLLGLWHYLSPASLDANRRILLYRITHLASGNSPVLPVFLLLAVGTWWCWVSLTGIILRGKKGPCLPDDSEFEGAPGLSSSIDRVRLKNLSNHSQAGLMRSLKPLGLEPRVLLPAAFVAWLLILVLGKDHPVQALDGDHYEDFYGILLFAALFLLLNSVFRLVVVWIEFRSLLRTLEDLPLRRSFDRLKGFAWQSLWRLAGSAGSGLLNFYRLISRELESLQKFLKLEAVTPTSPAEPTSYAEFIRCINETETQSDTLCESFVRGGHAPRGFWQRPDNSWQSLLESFHAQLAKTCAAALVYLSGKWNTERCPNAEELKEEQKKECDAADENKRFCDPIPCPLTACAERFVCLFFLAYILVILQRIQTLVLSCAGIFLFILMSVNSYPFEPHLRLRSLLVALFFLILGAVGLVYSGMHRNATLSRITDTKPGELGIAFWIRMGAFIVVPALGLLAAQFPEIGGFLFSWLQPAAESLSR
jgi:hypothetical protein